MISFGFKVIEGSELPVIKNARLADPQKIGEALMAIDKDLGKIQPQAIVNTARDEASPLHPHFEWDDGLAAEAHRLAQARGLVRCITVLPTPRQERNGMRPRPAFLSIATEEDESRGYRPLAVVLDNARLQEQVLEAAERDLLAWETRYNMLVDVCALVRSAREKIAEKLETAKINKTVKADNPPQNSQK